MNTVVVLALLCAMVWGVAPIFEKLSLRDTTSFVALTIRSVATSITLILIAFFTGREREIVGVSLYTLSYILIGGFFGILGLYIYFTALKMGTPSKVVPLVNVFPLFTALYAAAFLGEKLTPTRLIGIALVVAGVILINGGLNLFPQDK